MSDDPFATLATRQRTMIRNALERKVLFEARRAMDEADVEGYVPISQRWVRAQAGVAVLESYRAPLEALWEQDRLYKEAHA